MKHGGSSAACIAQRIARAARGEGKTGEGKVSTEAIASILGLPGEPIFSETGVGGVGTRIPAISLHSDLHLRKTPDMLIRVEFPTLARACERETRRAHDAVENSFTAVQHLTKPLFLSKPVEPPLTSPDRASLASAPRLPNAGPRAAAALAGPEISRFPRKAHPCKPGSPTTPGRSDARVNASDRVAFRRLNSLSFAG